MCQTFYCGQRCEDPGEHEAETPAADGLAGSSAVLPGGPQDEAS